MCTIVERFEKLRSDSERQSEKERISKQTNGKRATNPLYDPT